MPPTLYRKSDLCIPRNETARPRSLLLHSCICEPFTYPRIGLSFWLQQNRQMDPENIKITHRLSKVLEEIGAWDYHNPCRVPIHYRGLDTGVQDKEREN
jgi:hypothetical protein